MSTTIQIKRSSTASGVPLSTDLAVGELAVNLVDKRLFTKKADGTIIELSTNPTDLDATTLRIAGVGITASATELNSLDGFTGSTAELNFVDGVTSNIQTQLNNKQPLDAQLTDVAGLIPADGSFIVGNGTNFVAESGNTAIASLGVTATAAELNTLDGITATTTELNYTDGVTSNIQTQLNGKATTAQGALADSAVQPLDNVSFGTGSFSGAVDVTGTVTADGLTVDGTTGLNWAAGASSSGLITIGDGGNSGGSAWFNTPSLSSVYNSGFGISGSYGSNLSTIELGAYGVKHPSYSSEMSFLTQDVGTSAVRERLKIHNNGDVSFYEDTGTTAKMVWDASAESLGIGTASPTSFLDVRASGTSIPSTISLVGTNSLGSDSCISQIKSLESSAGSGSSELSFHTRAVGGAFATPTERMRIDASGNVGIGTASPNLTGYSASSTVETISVANNTGALGVLEIGGSRTASGQEAGIISFHNNNNATPYAEIRGGRGSTDSAAGDLRLYTGATERARIDSSGNLLVGKTTTNLGTAGTAIWNDGRVYASRTSGSPIVAERLSTDGDIASFFKDGSTVGSIGSYLGAYPYITSSTNKGLVFGVSDVNPCGAGGVASNGEIDLGGSTRRFKDLYLSGGVYLGGTGAANKLDDYETGTFTPVLTDGTNSATWANEAVGFYTKVGNVVNFFIRFNSSSTAIGTYAYSAVTGLPFTSIDSELASNVNVSRCFSLPPSSNDFTAGISGTYVIFRELLSNNTSVTFTPTANSVRFTLAGTYRTAA